MTFFTSPKRLEIIIYSANKAFQPTARTPQLKADVRWPVAVDHKRGEREMSEKVSAFWPVQMGPSRYLFFIVNWNDYSNSITESLEKNIATFGRDLGLQGTVIQAYENAKAQTFEEIKEKGNWPYDVHARFDSELYPFMVLINTDFATFDPENNEWAIVWFSDFSENPNSISEIFASLIRKMQRGDSLFNYFNSLTRKKAAKKFIGYFEMKPGIFGFSVDIKAMLEDLGSFVGRRPHK